MAYNSDKENTSIIGSVAKGSKGDEIQVKHITNKITGREQVDIRLMYVDAVSGELRHGRQGVRFGKENLLDIIKLMASILSDEETEQLVQSLGYTTGGSDEGDGE